MPDMTRAARRVLPLAGLLLAAFTAHAQPAPQVPPPAPLWGTVGLATRMEKPSDVSRFASVKLSLPQAMAAVARHRDGRIVEIGFGHHGSSAWYSVIVAGADGLHYLRVDPVTGDIGAGEHPDIPRDELDAVGQRDLDGLRNAMVDLPHAVEAVAKTSGEKVICAGVEQLGGVPRYYVQTVAKHRLASWVVDPGTGRVAQPSW